MANSGKNIISNLLFETNCKACYKFITELKVTNTIATVKITFYME